MTFKIGDIEIKNQVVLAPMAGISDPTYMKICEEMGVGYAITELISSEALIRGSKKTLEMLNGIEKLNIPVAVQIFGSKPSTMAKAARILVDSCQVKIIDINMGCPVPKVALRSEAGSALLKNPKKVKEIISEVVNAVDVPVTIKIRSGWDNKSVNAVEIAKIAEKAGVKAIAIHGRTRSEGYSGKVNLDIIKEVKESVSIPVIGNGDIKSYLDAKKMLDYTGCDAIMIGRGVLGNPWLIKECVDYLEKGLIPNEIDAHTKIAMIKKHLDMLIEAKGEKVACLEMRGHFAWYLKGLANTKKLRVSLQQVTKKEEAIKILDSYEEEQNALEKDNC